MASGKRPLLRGCRRKEKQHAKLSLASELFAQGLKPSSIKAVLELGASDMQAARKAATHSEHAPKPVGRPSEFVDNPQVQLELAKAVRELGPRGTCVRLLRARLQETQVLP